MVFSAGTPRCRAHHILIRPSDFDARETCDRVLVRIGRKLRQTWQILGRVQTVLWKSSHAHCGTKAAEIMEESRQYRFYDGSELVDRITDGLGIYRG